MTHNPCLVVENVVKTFGKLKALDNISLTLNPGECLALLGSNGAGKTTLCEILTGLQPCDNGSIKFGKLSQPDDRSKILEIIGVQLQETSLYKKYTVRETFQLFASFYRSAIPPDELITKLGLTDKADSRIETLSGGQRQAVYLGCALVNRPQILFLDEPTTGLDPNARQAIWKLLEQLRTEGCSILLTTHHMEEASHLASRIAIIDHGKIIALDHPEALVKRYCGSGWLDVRLTEPLERTAFLHSMRTTLPWVTDASISGNSCTLAGNDLSSHISELFVQAHEQNFNISEVALRGGTLEDVFIKMTGRGIENEH